MHIPKHRPPQILAIGFLLLILIGGILLKLPIKSFHSLTLHSKIMIVGTVSINVIAILVIFLLEHNNPGTLGSLTASEKWRAAYFQAITTRTAGFMTISISDLHQSTQLFMMMLMFIGAGSISAGGGIKLTTFIIILFAIGTFVRHNKKSPNIFRRKIDVTDIFRALAVVITSLLAIFIAVFTLTIIESIPFLPLLFEVVSAFGTIGLSTGITGDLSTIGKLIIMFVMYLGLVGPLTLALSLTDYEKEKIRYPSEDVFTG